MIQLILHLIGDYVTQSDWMAKNKTKNSFAAAAHALVYSLPFLLLGPSWTAFAVILVTHFLIDRFRLARYVVYAKNLWGDPNSWATMFRGYNKDRREHELKWGWANCSATGYHKDDPPWLSVWLLIAADNTLHLLINFLALKHL